MNLTPTDNKQIDYWLKATRNGAIGGLTAGTLFLAVAGILLWLTTTAFRPDMGAFLITFLFGGIGAFFIIKAAGFLQKGAMARKYLAAGPPVSIRGTLEQVTPRNGRLIYQVNGHPYEVYIIPGTDKRYSGALFRNLFDVAALTATPVVIDLVKINEQQFLLLNIRYEGHLPETKKITPGAASDFSNGKKSIHLLFFATGLFMFILLIGMAICWPVYNSSDIAGSVLSLFLLSIFLFPALLAYRKWKQLKASDQRWVVAGTVTEVVKAKEKFTKGGSYTTLYWYRVGSELICSYGDIASTPPKIFHPGEKVQVIYQCDAQLKIFRLIEITGL